MKKSLLPIALLFILVGCSVGPSSSDVEAALQSEMRTSVKKQFDAMKALSGQKGVEMAKSMGIPDPDSISVNVKSVENIKEMDDGDFTLTVTFETSVNDKATESSAKLRMTEVDGKWKIIESRNI